MFEADVRAFLAWWVSGERKRRAQRTGDQYLSWIRKWPAGNIACSIESIDTPTIRGCRAFVAEIRARSEWNAHGATRALKAWSRWMVADALIESDPLAELPYLPEPQVSPTLPVAESDDIAALLDTCGSNSFEDVRDRALINVLADAEHDP